MAASPLKYIEIKSYKICLIGEPGSGKTSYVRKFLTKDFLSAYAPTLGCDVTTHLHRTANDWVHFNIWDCAGQEHLAGLRDAYYIGADACLLFTTPQTVKEAKNWYYDFQRVSPNATVILCVNKVDESSSLGRAPAIAKTLGCPLYDLSIKADYNFNKPIDHLTRRFLGLVEPEAVVPTLTAML